MRFDRFSPMPGKAAVTHLCDSVGPQGLAYAQAVTLRKTS